jgi:hypothetical protein
VPRHKGPHKYRRILIKDEYVYRCVLKGCLHYIQEAFIEGQEALCNRCDKPFTITKRSLVPRKIVKPHCKACNRPTFNRAVGKVTRGSLAENVIPVSDDDLIAAIFGDKEE